MPDFVYIKHPDVATLGGPVTRSALNDVYSDKGWSEATVDEVRQHEYNQAFRVNQASALTTDQVDEIVADVELTTDEVDAVSKRGELDKLALLRGVDPTEHPNMQSLAAAIKATIDPASVEPTPETQE
jgi:hypothetical protein